MFILLNIISDMIDTSNNLILDVEPVLANKQVKPVKGPVTLHLLNLPGNVNCKLGGMFHDHILNYPKTAD